MSIWQNLNQIDGLYQCQSPGCDVTLWLRKEAREGHSASLYGTAYDCMWLQSSQNYESQRQTQTVLCSSSCPCSSSWSFHSHHLCPLSLALQLLFKCHPFLAPLRNHFPRVTNSAASVPPVRASSHVHDLHPLLTCHSGGILLPCSASHLPTPPTGPSNVAKSSTLNYRTSCTWSGVNGLEVISSMFSAPMINLWFRQEAFSPVPPRSQPCGSQHCSCRIPDLRRIQKMGLRDAHGVVGMYYGIPLLKFGDGVCPSIGSGRFLRVTD